MTNLTQTYPTIETTKYTTLGLLPISEGPAVIIRCCVEAHSRPGPDPAVVLSRVALLGASTASCSIFLWGVLQDAPRPERRCAALSGEKKTRRNVAALPVIDLPTDWLHTGSTSCPI